MNWASKFYLPQNFRKELEQIFFWLENYFTHTLGKMLHLWSHIRGEKWKFWLVECWLLNMNVKANLYDWLSLSKYYKCGALVRCKSVCSFEKEHLWQVRMSSIFVLYIVSFCISENNQQQPGLAKQCGSCEEKWFWSIRGTRPRLSRYSS